MPKQKPNISPSGPCIIDLIRSPEMRDLKQLLHVTYQILTLRKHLLYSSGFWGCFRCCSVKIRNVLL